MKKHLLKNFVEKRKLIFTFLAVVILSFTSQGIFAETISVSETCESSIIAFTISDSDKEIANAHVYIYIDSEMKKLEEKIITDETGQAKFDFSDKTNIAKIKNNEHGDAIHKISCIEKFRNQSVRIFSVVDSSIGVIEDPKTGLTIVDLGTFYGIAGNGTIPNMIKIFKDERLWATIDRETGISPSTSHSEWQIPQTFFYNETPGKYRLVLITNNTETLEYEFIVEQITKDHNNSNKEQKIPQWFKTNIFWWSDGKINDKTFQNSIEFMINKKIIVISDSIKQNFSSGEKKIPQWIKENAVWWAEGKISEDTFLVGIKHMIEKGMIKIS